MNTGYKTIAVHVNQSARTLARVTYAARWATAFDAHLVGVAATGLPASFYVGGLAGEGVAMASTYGDLLLEQSRTALAMAESAADREGVRSFEKRLIEEEAGIAMCLQARYSDLVIVGQDDPDDMLPAQRAMVAEYTVLNSANPVLIMPYTGDFTAAPRRVLVAWDGSLEAARAVQGALPVLKHADMVQIAVFNPRIGADAHGEEPGADIALFLARHGIKIEVTSQATGGDIDIGNAILSHIADSNVDLMVMGAYGHSRFREVLLGGTTRTILRSMTVPVLMSH
jgi:nucleotide-binding universal stress UspA family protein